MESSSYPFKEGNEWLRVAHKGLEAHTKDSALGVTTANSSYTTVGIRLVLRNFNLREGMDFHEIYAAVILPLHDVLQYTGHGKINTTNLPKWVDQGKRTCYLYYPKLAERIDQSTSSCRMNSHASRIWNTKRTLEGRTTWYNSGNPPILLTF